MNENSNNKLYNNKAKETFEHEMKLLNKVIKQCTDENLEEEVGDFKHYKLPTGQHVYAWNGQYVLTNQEIRFEYAKGQYLSPIDIGDCIFSEDIFTGHGLISPNIRLYPTSGIIFGNGINIEYRLGKELKPKRGRI